MIKILNIQYFNQHTMQHTMQHTYQSLVGTEITESIPICYVSSHSTNLL